MSQRRHEYAVVRATDEGELVEHLQRLDDAGYTIRDIFATATRHPQEPIIYTVVAVKDREAR